MRTTRLGSSVAISALLMAMPLGGAPGPSGATAGEWRSWGGDPATSHYAPLEQVDRTNVKDLQLAWRWKSTNFGPRPDNDWKATPLMVNGVLYVTAGSARDVAAIDATSGQTLWVFHEDEGTRGRRAPNRGLGGRGLSYWTDGKDDQRLILVSLGYRLIALNPKTGRPIATFGKDGVVDLWEGFDQSSTPGEGQFSLTSPAAIVSDVIVVGAALGGGTAGKSFIAGFPRGFDVRTGKRLWVFRTIPQPGEFGNDTWERDSWAYTGHTGAWAPMSADEELGYVYLPIETPTNDYYGGHRPGNGLFGNTLVCLDAKTGKRVWHFQLTHHDIWDYDIPAAANLADITVAGRHIKALAQVTKQGFVFVLNRVTGEPVWPIVERPVPQSTVPGEKTSPTQPIPTRPAPFELQGLRPEDVNDLTPALKAEALELVKGFNLGPVYTPGTMDKPSIISPSPNGGANWPGAALDPETNYLYVGSANEPRVLQIVQDPKRCAGADYCGDQKYFPETLLHGLPLVRPPWGRITAIDLNTGDHVWSIPNGPTSDAVRNNPVLKGVHLPRTGTASQSVLLVTKTLLFAGAGGLHSSIPPRQGQPLLLALDKKTGEVLRELKLPDGLRPSGAPMTYVAQKKQFIVVAASATMKASGIDLPGELLAFTLGRPAGTAPAAER